MPEFRRLIQSIIIYTQYSVIFIEDQYVWQPQEEALKEKLKPSQRQVCRKHEFERADHVETCNFAEWRSGTSANQQPVLIVIACYTKAW